MDFNPQDANSTGAAPTTLPEGVYALKVSDAEEQTSAKGNKMIVVLSLIHISEPTRPY